MTAALYRRLAGIALLLVCALRFTPGATDAGLLDSVLLPAAATLGVWLVFANPVVTAICVLALAIAHSQLGSPDLLRGYLYPALAVAAAIALLFALRRTPQGDPPATPAPPTDQDSP